MAKNAWFTQWFNSTYYHQLYSHRDDKEAADFINRLLTHLHPAPESRLLDLGCGRGRHSRILASLGYDVTGIDVAPENIRFAQQYETDSLRFQVHDMRKPLCVRCVDFVFNFFTSFGFFNTEKEHLQALHTMATALNANGKLVMDYINSAAAVQSLVLREEKTDADCHYLIERSQTDTHFYKKITVTHTEGSESETAIFTEQIAKFSRAKLTAMMEKKGLNVIEVFGDYSLNAYDQDRSPRLILIAQKN